MLKVDFVIPRCLKYLGDVFGRDYVYHNERCMPSLFKAKNL